MAMQQSIVVSIVFLMLLLIILLIVIACRPWRYFFSSSRSRSIIKVPSFLVEELERPLVSDEGGVVRDQNNDLTRNYDVEEAYFQNEGLLRSPRTQGLIHKPRVTSASPPVTQGDSLVLDVITETLEDISVGETLKHPLKQNQIAQVQKHVRQEEVSKKFGLGNDGSHEVRPEKIVDQRSCLSLEVISGPSSGLQCSVQSTSASKLILGRVSPSDFVLKDSEVSGKHALVNWNSNKLKWELVDMGSLNGTLLNSQPISHHDSGSRQWGDPVELANGDIITLGTTSNIYVHITSEAECQIPFGVGVASDPMALRRGGKKLPMEDACFYQWPLPGVDQFGIFGICDGHGGSNAAKSATRLLPKIVAAILSDSLRRERVLLERDASDVLRDAFYQTEASMNNYYEGCTATVLLIWTDGDKNYFAQCANLGDSACVLNVDGKQTKMTEDHRVVSYNERLRIKEMGEPLKDGETRLCGLNLARMLGDKFLKQQDARFSFEPYISQVVQIDQRSDGFAILASDGFWDVISAKKAVQLVVQTKEKFSSDRENSTEKIANVLLSEAKSLRTKDNTTIIYLDFDSAIRSL